MKKMIWDNKYLKMHKIGILGRSGGSFKRGKVLVNIGRMLKDDFELDLIINSEEVNPKVEEYYNIKNYVNFNVGKSSYVKLFFNDLINLYRYCKRERPNILFQYTHPFIQGPAIAIIGKLTKTKTITRFSGSSFDLYKKRKDLMKIVSYFTNKWFMRLMFLADKIIVLGESQRREAIAHGCKPEKIVVLNQPVDEKNFYPPKSKEKTKERLGLDKDKKIILWVGNLKEYKGLSSLKELIKKASENYLFMIIGRDFNNNAKKLEKVGKNVRIEGLIPNKEMVKYYQAADLLIHTSHIEAAIPNTIWEALACGTPCIGRDIRDIKKVADAVFETDEELIDLVLNKGWKSSKESKVPKEYKWDNLKKRYIELFEG